MSAQPEKNQQQVRWEQFLTTVSKDVLEQIKFPTAEAFAIKFFLQLHFLEHEYGNTLPPVLEAQGQILADRQATWSGLPLRPDVTADETTQIFNAVRDASERLESVKKAHADSQNFQKVNYPQLVAGIMESIRLHGPTPLPENALALLTRSQKEEPMEQFGDTLLSTFSVLFGMPETPAVQALPAPVQFALAIEKKSIMSADVDPGFHWKEIGIDHGGADYQSYNNALLDLAARFPEILPQPEKNSRRLVLELKTLPDTQVLAMLQQTFQPTTKRSEPEKPIARMLALIAWKEGEKVQDWHVFLEHARTIMDGTASTLLPEIPTQVPLGSAQGAQPVKEAAAPTEVVRTDRFPHNDEEIALCIQSKIVLIQQRIKDKGISVKWPMNQATFENIIKLGIPLVNDLRAEGFIKPDDLDGSTPYFYLPNYIKILALKEYRGNYGMSNREVAKMLERFDEIYREKFVKR